MSNKKLPYGNCNFADLIERGFAYVDKTCYIELLENENNGYQFVLRPRRFGKSLFLSTLDSYYDINSKDKFEALFGGLYVGSHPTPERGKYAVMSFDFSSVVMVSYEQFIASFSNVVQEGVCMFFDRYENIFADAAEEKRRIKEHHLGIDALRLAYGAAAKANVPIFVIVDEYDNFANDLIVIGDVYKNEITKQGGGDGIVRTFYKSLKAGTSTVVRRIFITGVSPMMLNDLSSGFNMSTDYSLIPKYNEMFGFTRDEVEWLMDETGIDRSLISVDMEYYYNGYMFSNEGKDKVYNSQMTLYLFDQIVMRGKQPTQVVDINLKPDSARIHSLAGNENNRARLLGILKDGETSVELATRFSLDELNREDYFVSLLFYLGMLTRGGTHRGRDVLKIPNYSIKTLYWEYLGYYIQTLTEKTVRDPELEETISQMAYDGEVKPYWDYFTENILKRLSNRDLAKFDEKYIKATALTTLFLSSLYHPISEPENINGYIDIYLLKNPTKPDIKYEYVFEIKYIKTEDAENENLKEAKFAEALAQLEKYKRDKRVAGRDDVKFFAVVFVGKGDYEMREAASMSTTTT